MKNLRILACGIALSAAGACASDEPTGSGVEVGFTPTTENAALANQGITIRRFEMNLDAVTMISEREERRFDGDYWLDLINPEDSMLPRFDLPAADWSGIELQSHAGLAVTEGALLDIFEDDDDEGDDNDDGDDGDDGGSSSLDVGLGLGVSASSEDDDEGDSGSVDVNVDAGVSASSEDDDEGGSGSVDVNVDAGVSASSEDDDEGDSSSTDVNVGVGVSASSEDDDEGDSSSTDVGVGVGVSASSEDEGDDGDDSSGSLDIGVGLGISAESDSDDGDDSSSASLGLAVWVMGSFHSEDGDESSFDLRIASFGSLRFEGDDDGDRNSRTNLWVDFNVEAWFDGVDRDSLKVSADGMIRIDTENNQDAYSRIVANLRTNAELRSDD